MRYKVLLLGRNKSIIDDFFKQGDDRFELETTSIRNADLLSHVKYFQPDVVLYCMKEEYKETIANIARARNDFRHPAALALVGEQEDINEYYKTTIYTPDLTMPKPITIMQIEEQLSQYILTHKNAETEKKAPKVTETPKTARSAEDDDLMKKILSEDFDLDKLLAGGGIEPEPTSDRRKHVLVVDDDAIMLKTIKRNLEDEYDVATAVSGKIAMKFLENKKTDLVLLDYEMPGENGADVLMQLRGRGQTKDLPVIFLTGISDKDKIQQVLALKPQGYLLKPVERDKLLAKIKEIIG